VGLRSSINPAVNRLNPPALHESLLPADIPIINMSSPLAGKFQDHYLILNVEPKSDSEAIQAAYTKLAQKFHPNNLETGD
jgi:hypothetical protein